MSDDLLSSWEHALPAVLALMNDQQRGMFRQELQRFLATSRFHREAATSMAGPLQELLLGSARAAGRPRAIAALREPEAAEALVGLCEHLLARWRAAEEAASASSPNEPEARDGIFFGPRLGGPGRTGAIRRQEPDEP